MFAWAFIYSYFIVLWGVGSTQTAHVSGAVEENQGGIDGFYPKYLESFKQEMQREFRRELDQQREFYNKQIAELNKKFDEEISALKDELSVVKQDSALSEQEHPVINELYKDRNNVVVNEPANETMTKQQQFTSVGLMDALQVPKIHSPHTRQVESESPVAFYAILGQTTQQLGSQQTVIFDNEITNAGNAYDKYSGLFKAPVAGLYVFSTTLVVHVADTAHFGFYLNDTALTYIFLHGLQNNYDSSSNTIILRLNKGDDISVKHRDSNNRLHGDSFSMFSGFLLSRDFSQSSIVVGK